MLCSTTCAYVIYITRKPSKEANCIMWVDSRSFKEYKSETVDLNLSEDMDYGFIRSVQCIIA